ncbi:MAG: DUF3391 domain-containing protein, partial [Pseudomonadales bacterium]
MPNTRKVPINELEIGMYVSNLDRPWLETPFLLQGFVLETEEDISTLLKYCNYVHVDLERSTTSTKRSFQPLNTSAKKSVTDIFSDKKLAMYTDKSSWKKEFPRAKVALKNLSDCVKNIISSTDKNNTF